MDRIGEIVFLKGVASANTGGESREIALGSPVYAGDVLETGTDSNIEIKFADETVLSQGPGSRFVIDEYVFDDAAEPSAMLFNLAVGTFRMVTGKIAEENPENVNVKSPLATIGIRGTTTIHRVNADGSEKHGAEDLTGDHVLVLTDQFGNTQFVTFDAGGADFNPGVPMTTVRMFSPNEIQEFRQVVPLTSVGESSGDGENQAGEGEESQENGENDADEEAGEDAEGGNDADGEAEAEGQEEVVGEEALEGQEPGAEGQGAVDDLAASGEEGGQQGFSDPMSPADALAGDPFGSQGSWGGLAATGEAPGAQAPVFGPSAAFSPTGVAAARFRAAEVSQGLSAADDAAGDDDVTLVDDVPADGEQFDPGELADVFDNIIIGTSANDRLVGTDSRDAIFGLGGNDIIFGGLGEDLIAGGPGDDYINGYLAGQSAPTDFWGESEPNVAAYWNAGGPVYVNLGLGRAFGAAGNDTLVNIFEVIGSAYDDTLIGQAGEFNFFEGGRGDDSIVGVSAKDNGASYMFASGSVIVDLEAGRAFGADGNDTLVDITSVEGSEYDDTLLGNNDPHGYDTFEPKGGDDYVNGRAGDNRVDYDDAGNAMYVDLLNGFARGEGDDTLVNINRVKGSDYNDTLLGDDGFNALRGGKGDDIIAGRGGDDRVEYNNASGSVLVDLDAGRAYGADGRDTLFSISDVRGSGFDDSLFGDSGANQIEGWVGDDYIDGRGGVDGVVYWDATGGVQVNLNNGSASGAQGDDTLVNIEGVFGSMHDDTLVGDAGDNFLNGNQGNDSLAGLGGADSLNGDIGNDFLLGGSGADVLRGGDGDDTLRGGLGQDVINGGSGSDVFLHQDIAESSPFGDTYEDFSHADDTFLFDATAFDHTAQFSKQATYSGNDSGVLNSAVFVYETSTNKLYYDPDGDSGASADETIAVFLNDPDDFDASDISFT